MNAPKFQFLIVLLFLLLFSKSICQDSPWENIGPWMGYIHDMAMDNAKPDTVYAATQYGLYKSVDGAENWELLNLPMMEIKTVTVAQSNPNLLLCSSEFKAYRSDDYGNTWDTIFSDTMRIMSVIFNPANPATVLIGSDAQYTISGWKYEAWSKWINISYNGGETWGKLFFTGIEERDCPRTIKYITMDPSDTAKIYIGTEGRSDGGILVSHDNGANWIYKQLTNRSEEILALTCTPANYENHTVCAIVKAGAIDREFYISLDSGLTWMERPPPSTMALGGNIRDNAFYISPDYPEWVYIGADYQSEDRRSSVIAFNLEDEKWYYIIGAPHTYPTSLLTCNEVDYLGFRYHGMYTYSATDTVWSEKNKGMNSGEVYDLAVNPKDPDKILTAIRSNMARTADGGDTWELTDRDFSALAISKEDTSFIIAGSKPPYYLSYLSSYYYYTSNNGGVDWTSHSLFRRGGFSDYNYKFWTGDIIISETDPDKYILGIDGGGGAGEGIYITEDGGSSWLENFGAGVSTLAQDPNDENIVYLGTTGLGYIRRSGEGGKNWQAISPGGDDAFVKSVWDIAVDNNGQVFAATSEGLFKWEGGTTWNQVQGLPAIVTKAVVIDNNGAVPAYYAGTEGQGVFISEDGGLTWKSFNKELGTLNITRLKIGDSYPRNLYACTKDGGIWITTIQESATFAPTLNQPDFTIGVFPNPNNGTFIITSNADSELRGEIKIINLLGKIVYADNSFHVSPGSDQEVNLDNVSPGNYVLVFTNASFTINKKVIIYSTR